MANNEPVEFTEYKIVLSDEWETHYSFMYDINKLARQGWILVGPVTFGLSSGNRMRWMATMQRKQVAEEY